MMKMSTRESAEHAPRRRRQADRRPALVAALRAAGRPLSVDEVAAAIGTSVPTARFHLSLLVSAGQVARVARRRGSAGRPAWGYTVAAASPATPTTAGPGDGDVAYRQLARVLAAQLDGAEGAAAAAREAGRRWAATVAPDAAPVARTPAEAMDALTRMLDDAGFAAEADASAAEIVLRRCPFEEVAREHRAVVCGVHLGLVEQAAASVGGGLAVDGLEPFRSEAPLTCAVHLSLRT